MRRVGGVAAEKREVLRADVVADGPVVRNEGQSGPARQSRIPREIQCASLLNSLHCST